MDTKELMLGDWVKYQSCQIEKVKSLGMETINDTHEGHYEPIPITEEILEKNGLNVRTEDEDGIELSLLNMNYRVLYHFGYQWAYVISREDINYAGKVLYVHELQHALRLGKLNELADNFTI